MNTTQQHLAQLNIARMLAPMDSEIMRDFKNGLEPINALAERSPGFVWRLKDDVGNGNATSLRVFDDEMIIVNVTIWESPEALFDFAYKSHHTEFLRRRAEWFEKSNLPVYVLWWIEAGHISTTDEAKKRLEHLHEHGETTHAFSFKSLQKPARQAEYI
jgi:Domain of unknown function (DUF3291)